jgi:hypothetical protein
MLVKNIHIILTAIAAIVNLSLSNAQQFIGFSGGYSKGTFLNFANKQDYDAKYHLKNGVVISSFYETKMDSTPNLRIELQYKFQNTDMEIKDNSGNYSFYKNINYSFQLLNLNLIYSLQLFENNSLKMLLPVGVTMAYTVNTKAKGNGWDFIYKTQVDTNGNPVQILTTQNWEKNESKSKDVSQFNFGLDIGLDLMIPLNNKLDFMIQNKYNIFLTNITTLKNLRYTSLLTGYLNFGLRYDLHK